MSGERGSTHERLLGAFGSSDLLLEADKRKDADYLIALGIASSRRGMEGSVLRLQLAGSQSDYRSARESVVRMTRRMSEVRNWRLSAINVRRVGELALAHHVFPACPVCHGRRYEVAEGAPALSGNICKPCHGTGVRPVQRKFNGEIRDVIEVLERVGQVTERAVARMLR